MAVSRFRDYSGDQLCYDVEAMSAKILVLILVSSLLGIGPFCRCEGHVQKKPKTASCGHCPPESAPQPKGYPVPDCCCIHQGSDRTTEENLTLLHNPVGLESDVAPRALDLSIAIEQAESIKTEGGIFRRAGPPLYILFRQFTI